LPRAIYQRKQLITAALADLPDGERAEVLDALDRLSESPHDPVDLRVQRARGAARRAGADFLVALPSGFVLTFRYHDSVPMAPGGVIQVQSFLRLIADS